MPISSQQYTWQVEGTTKPNHFPLVSFFSLYTHSPLHTAHTNIAFQSGVQLFETSCSGSSVAVGICLSECLAWLWSSSGTGMRGKQLRLTPTARGTTGANGIRMFMVGDRERNISHQLLSWGKQTLLGKNYCSFPNEEAKAELPAHHCPTALPWPISRTGTQKAKSFFHTKNAMAQIRKSHCLNIYWTSWLFFVYAAQERQNILWESRGEVLTLSISIW